MGPPGGSNGFVGIGPRLGLFDEYQAESPQKRLRRALAGGESRFKRASIPWPSTRGFKPFQHWGLLIHLAVRRKALSVADSVFPDWVRLDLHPTGSLLSLPFVTSE